MRGSSEDALRRAGLGLARGTIHMVNDKPKLQTIDIRGYDNELITGVENFAQPYGFKSVPLPPGDKAAEVVVGFINGNRSHPVILGHIDRRTAPTGWMPGDSGFWHHAGATARFTDKGFVKDAGSNKQPDTTTVGNATLTIADGKITATVAGTTIIVTDGKICLGDANASIPVMLKTGPSQLVFASK